MKKILTITLALICIYSSNAQIKKEKISYVSAKQDTLLLPNDSLGKLIASTWDNIYTKKPVIIFSDIHTINRKNEYLFVNREEKKFPKK